MNTRVPTTQTKKKSILHKLMPSVYIFAIESLSFPHQR